MTKQEAFLNQAVTPKKSRVKDFKVKSAPKKQVSGAVNKNTEVMLKVTGGAKGSAHVKSHIDYITRNGKLEAETETGDKLTSREELRKLAKDWTQHVGKTRANTKDTVNMVFSMPAGTNPEAVRKAVSQLAKENFAHNYRYLMVLHTDQKHPHVHLTVKTQGNDGQRLDPRKADLDKWRGSFAEKLQAFGVEATATPRAFRGVVKKGMKQSVYHAAKEERSTTHKAKLKEIINELKGGKPSLNPAAKAIVEQQKQVRADYLELAKQLGKSPDKADIKLATDIMNHLRQLPKTLKDERAEMRDKVMATLNKNKGQEQTGAPDREDDLGR